MDEQERFVISLDRSALELLCRLSYRLQVQWVE